MPRRFMKIDWQKCKQFNCKLYHTGSVDADCRYNESPDIDNKKHSRIVDICLCKDSQAITYRNEEETKPTKANVPKNCLYYLEYTLLTKGE